MRGIVLWWECLRGQIGLLVRRTQDFLPDIHKLGLTVNTLVALRRRLPNRRLWHLVSWFGLRGERRVSYSLRTPPVNYPKCQHRSRDGA